MATKTAGKKAPKKTYITPAGTCIYPHVVAPDTEGEYADDKFKVTLVLDADADLDTLTAAVTSEAEEKFGANFDPDTFQWPWRVRDDEDKKEELRGKITMIAKSQYQPDVRDAKRKDVPMSVITGKGKNGVYTKMAGDTVRLMGTLYLYEQDKDEVVVEGKKRTKTKITVYGCSFQLVAIQILAKRKGGNYGDGFGEADGWSQDGADTGSDDADDSDDDSSDGDY